jgi:hypothetical protein
VTGHRSASSVGRCNTVLICGVARKASNRNNARPVRRRAACTYCSRDNRAHPGATTRLQHRRRSWSPNRKSPSVGSTSTRPSRSWSPRPPWPSSSTTKRSASCAARRPSRCVASKDSGRGTLHQFPRPSVKHQVTQIRQGSVESRQLREGRSRGRSSRHRAKQLRGRRRMHQQSPSRAGLGSSETSSSPNALDAASRSPPPSRRGMGLPTARPLRV